MATVMTKRGSQDNVVTYTHICDLVVDGESGGLEVYIADSNKEWSMISVAAGGGGAGGLAIHICTTTEYDAVTKVPTIELPLENTIYLVPNGDTTGDLFVEWIYVDDAWEKIGSIADLSGLVQDVQINGTSVVQNGVANVPIATSAAAGVVKVNSTKGITISNGVLGISEAGSSPVQQGITRDYAITPFYQHSAAFYGLAKAAGADMKDIANPTTGTYPDAQKAAIQHMLGTDAAIADYEADTTADQAYAIGELFMLNGKLHQATAAIAVGDTLTAGTNCAVVNIADVFPHDVKVNGTSVVTDGVANVPKAGVNKLGVVQVHPDYGITILGSTLIVSQPSDATIKYGYNSNSPITPNKQHQAAFYGLAKAAGDTTQSESPNAVGQYTESAKSAISQMLNAPETVTGTAPTITAMAGVQYVCGEVATLDITLPASGCVDIRFESGSTPTVLTITPPTGVTVKWAGGFDPTALEANTVYEINIADGLGVAASWT